MQVNGLFVALIILLIPGIIATLILDATMQHKKWSNFLFSVYVILFGFFSYFILFIITLPFSLSPCIVYRFKGFAFFFNLKPDDPLKLNYWEIGFACLIAVPFSLLISYAVNHKWLTRFANKHNISDKYGDESLFYYYLNEYNNPPEPPVGHPAIPKWLTIKNLSTKTAYTGGLSSYSEQDGIQELALVDVDVYPAEGESYHLANIYICGKMGELSIEPLTITANHKQRRTSWISTILSLLNLTR